MIISGWGRYPVLDTQSNIIRDVEALQELLHSGFSGISMAMGRSYGDSALAEQTLNIRYLNHFLEFNEVSGELTCESGVTLEDIINVFVPRGWFLPVTPGTKFVSVGGAIASDVHGKNHHQTGSFSQFVKELKLVLPDGSIVTCSDENQPDLFHATCGGMGLTGVIVQATLKLKPIQSSYINETVIKAGDLNEIIQLLEEHSKAPYSVAWIDCIARGSQLGRSILYLGEHSETGSLVLHAKRNISVPFNLPSITVNHYSMAAFNTLYFHRVKAKILQHTVPLEPFFYPLDSIQHWNRIYGSKGFVQYQFVIPKDAGHYGIVKILATIAEEGRGSCLSVLKLLGAENNNYLSFPMEGYTLACDFKMEAGVLDLLKKLDNLVLDFGGRIYLAKDACMSEQTFKRSYPKWQEFLDVRQQVGADKVFHSLQSRRLGI